MEASYTRSEAEEKLQECGIYSDEEIGDILSNIYGPGASSADSDPGDGPGDPPSGGGGPH